MRYLERAQNTDGGFGGAAGQASNQLVTGWAVLGLEAAGRHPLDVRHGERTPIDFIRAGVRSLAETGELERTILALRGAGLDPRRFGGRDLLADLERKRRPDGSFSGLSNWTAFGIMSLRASGRSTGSAAVRRAGAWLARQQNSDGGFSYATRGGGSFVDETGAALQGLAAAGRRRTRVVDRASHTCAARRTRTAGSARPRGLAPTPSRPRGRCRAWSRPGARPHRSVADGRSPLAYLTSLQQPDGSFRYSRSSTQTPVWVTVQAIAALERKAFPVEEPERKKFAVTQLRSYGRKTSSGARQRAKSETSRARVASSVVAPAGPPQSRHVRSPRETPPPRTTTTRSPTHSFPSARQLR